MTLRAVAVLWLVVGGLLWNGVFDLYIAGGMRDYLQRRAEADLAQAAAPSMAAVMERATRLGVTAASAWAGLVVACGWLTIAIVRRVARREVIRAAASQQGPPSV